MRRKTLFSILVVAALLTPMATVAEVPIPDCYPCGPGRPRTPSVPACALTFPYCMDGSALPAVWHWLVARLQPLKPAQKEAPPAR